jgi:hypothetical protein
LTEPRWRSSRLVTNASHNKTNDISGHKPASDPRDQYANRARIRTIERRRIRACIVAPVLGVSAKQAARMRLLVGIMRVGRRLAFTFQATTRKSSAAATACTRVAALQCAQESPAPADWQSPRHPPGMPPRPNRRSDLLAWLPATIHLG